jgi:hypothetical protein
MCIVQAGTALHVAILSLPQTCSTLRACRCCIAWTRHACVSYQPTRVLPAAAADMLHPAGLGQKMMADLAVALLQDTAVDLLLQPWAQQDDAMLAEDIPEPMNPGMGLALSGYTDCLSIVSVAYRIVALYPRE